MKKSNADKLAYEFAKSRFEHSDYLLNSRAAKEVAEFIRVLSSELQQHCHDFPGSHQENMGY
ncbi:hypothetical protein BMT54_01190 [Pasteurellaceae bacterium 15-036681]|nr:hypothetical protein BMT54_01190 [Pasteurellaceae bacterium 15-036681]